MIKVDTGTMGAQVSSVSSTVANRVTSINTAIQSLNQLLQADNLQGNAYTGAKGYASQVLIPLLQALMMYSEAVSTYTTKNQTLYSTYFSDSQDSEQLNRDKERINSSLRIARETARILAATPLLTGVATKMAADFTIMLLESELRRVEEKVQKLERFNAQSAYTFSDIASLQTAVMQGLAQVDGNFGSFSSNTGFSSFLTGTPTWAKTVNSQWEKREKVITEFSAVEKKLKNGSSLTKEDLKIIESYQNRFPGVELPEHLQEVYSVNEFMENYGVSAAAGLAVDELTGQLYTSVVGETIEEGFIDFGVKKAIRNADYIHKHRYTIKNAAEQIIGTIPGATHGTIVKESSEIIAKQAANARVVNSILGDAVSFGPGVLVGVGLDMASGDTAEEAWGKEITTGLVTTAIIGGLAVAGVSTPIGWGIAIGIGVNMANDWLREEFPEVKEFEDNVGEAVVDGWNNLCNVASDTFSFVNPFD